MFCGVLDSSAGGAQAQIRNTFIYLKKESITIKKGSYIVAILILGFLLYKFSDGISSTKEVDEDVNETYYEYVAHPENFVETQAKIIAYTEFDHTDCFILALANESYITVEVALPNGTTVQTDILRDKEDEVGDVISIAYKKDADNVLETYMNATQLTLLKTTNRYSNSNA